MIQNMSINGRAAALTMLAAMLVIGCIDNFISLIARDAGLWQFQILRSAMGLPLIILASFLGFGTLWALRLWAVALRSFFVAFAMLFYFGSLAFMPLAQALAGLFTSPIFILLITAFILREPVGPARIWAVFIGFIGILLVLDSDWSTLSWISLAFCRLSGGCSMPWAQWRHGSCVKAKARSLCWQCCSSFRPLLAPLLWLFWANLNSRFPKAPQALSSAAGYGLSQPLCRLFCCKL